MTKPTVEELSHAAMSVMGRHDPSSTEYQVARALRERLVGEQQTRQEILKPSTCGVSGHFVFQLNGGHCIMCQRESNLVATAREEALDAYLSRLHELAGFCSHCGKRECAGRSSGTSLPERIRLDDVIRALKPTTEAGGGENAKR